MVQNSKFFNLKKWLVAHKISSVVIAVVILLVGYWGYGKLFGSATGQTTYAIAAVQKQTIISTVSGSGQVSASNQVDLTSKVSGDVVVVPVKVGQTLSAGGLIAQIDSADAKFAFENAKIALQKLTQPADALSTTQAQNALADAKSAGVKAYSDAYDSVIGAFVDLPGIISGLNDVLNNSNKSPYLSDNLLTQDVTSTQEKATALHSYSLAVSKYNQAKSDYQNIKRTDSADKLKLLVNETLSATQAVSQAVKDTSTVVNFVVANTTDGRITTAMSTDQSNLTSWSGKITTDSSALSSSANSLISSAQSLTEKQQALDKLVTGADPLDVQTQELNVAQKQQAYDDSFIRAPFAGVVASLNVQAGDTINSGASIGAFITKQKVADIALNEVDVTKVKAGQKVNLTFDAIDGLTITGQVASVNLVGTVSQGVVSYDVKIGFDTQDDRVKAGMSINATIITDVKPDVLAVPNGAIKTQNSATTVLIADKSVSATTGSQTVTLATVPQTQTVVTGLADDNYTEIVSGLSEGDKVVTKTVAGTATQTTASAPSLFSAAGVKTGGSGSGSTRATTGR